MFTWNSNKYPDDLELINKDGTSHQASKLHNYSDHPYYSNKK